MLQLCPECRDPNPEKPVRDVPEEGYAAADCPECGATYRFRYLPLYALEGAPATGKSTTAGRLDPPASLTVVEGDAHVDLTGDGLSWAAICDLDFRICATVHAAGSQALFVGGMAPHDPADSPETRYFSRIERCALVCEDGDYRERLGRRDGIGPEAVEGFLEVNRWYRERGPDEGIETVNTTDLDPDAVAGRVRDWIGADRWTGTE